MSEKLEAINPRERTTTMGVRGVPKEITVYPLSVGDQLKLTEAISRVLKLFFEKTEDGSKIEKMSDIAVIESLIETIKENIERIAELTTDEKDLLNNMTNEQFLDYVDIVYDMNFGSVKKKLGNLIQKMFPEKKKEEPPKEA